MSQMSPIHTKPYIHACLHSKSIKGVQESQIIGIHHQNMIPLWTVFEIGTFGPGEMALWVNVCQVA